MHPFGFHDIPRVFHFIHPPCESRDESGAPRALQPSNGHDAVVSLIWHTSVAMHRLRGPIGGRVSLDLCLMHGVQLHIVTFVRWLLGQVVLP